MTRNRMSRRRLATVSLGLTMVALPAMAQTPSSPVQAAAPSTTAASIPAYASGLNGRDVRVTADGVQHRGVVSSLSTAGLVLSENGAPTAIPFSKVERVEKVTHRVRKGTLIGLASGAGLGILLAGMCEEDASPGCGGIIFGLVSAIGAGAGAGLGAFTHSVRKDGDVLYQTSRKPTTVSFAPILSRTRKGAAFSVAWR
jgi:hypothetical protein